METQLTETEVKAVLKKNRGMRPVALFVGLTEPCSFALEEDRQSPGFKGWRRYRFMRVVRNDIEHDYVEDLGPQSEFTSMPPVQILGAGDWVNGRREVVHTVGEMIEMLEEHNAMTHRVPRSKGNLIDAYLDKVDRSRSEYVRKGKGPSLNGY